MTDERPETTADIVGPGTGGSPTGAGTGDPSDPHEAAEEPEVAALVDNLRRDTDDDVALDTDDAAEQAGTGTDR
jgi:hypothetical protein